jgi:hypothetical protein
VLAAYVLFTAGSAIRQAVDRYQHGDRPYGEIAKETPESKKADTEIREVAPSSWRVATSTAGTKSAPGKLNTKRLSPESNEKVEERSGFDLDGDGLVAGRSGTWVDEQKHKHGGRQGRAEASDHPSTAHVYTYIKGFTVGPTYGREAIVDGIWDETTGDFIPKVTIEQAGAVTWPNEVEFSGSARYNMTTKNWKQPDGQVFWTPMAVNGIVGIGVGLDYDGNRADDDRWNIVIGARVRCLRLKTCTSY